MSISSIHPLTNHDGIHLSINPSIYNRVCRADAELCPISEHAANKQSKMMMSCCFKVYRGRTVKVACPRISSHVARELTEPVSVKSSLSPGRVLDALLLTAVSQPAGQPLPQSYDVYDLYPWPVDMLPAGRHCRDWTYVRHGVIVLALIVVKGRGRCT